MTDGAQGDACEARGTGVLSGVISSHSGRWCGRARVGGEWSEDDRRRSLYENEAIRSSQSQNLGSSIIAACMSDHISVQS